jgi:cytidylate kinase
MTTKANQVGAGLERAMRHWRERGALLKESPGASAAKPITVAISRERGAGGRAIAEAVADRLGWPLYDRDLVERIAEDTGVRAELLHQLDENRPNWVGELFHGLSDEKQISGAGYALRLHRTLLGLGYHGDCVIVGRGAAQLLPPERTVRVVTVAPREHRVKRLSEMLGNERHAATHVDETDMDRAAFVRHYYHKDPTDHEQYDLVLDTSKLSHDECVERILSAVDKKRGTNRTGEA